MKRALSILVLGLSPALFSACVVQGYALYGEQFYARPTLAASEVLADPAGFDGETVTVKGEIEEVCAQKGCWMVLDGGGEQMRVTFKDYGFFMPLDSAGRDVTVHGVFGIREVPVEEARHYLEDAGRPEEAAKITEPQRTYELVASGVRLANE